MINDLDLKTIQGLSNEEAAQRLQQEGYNELPSSKKRGVVAIAFEVVKEPMFLLLLASGLLYLLLGETRDALMLLGFVFVVMGITLYQERKTERALDALRDLSSPRALVIRGGEQVRIPGREVVRDDILMLAEGDRVPADATLLSAINLAVDESLLTGESVPVRKISAEGPVESARPGGDDLPFVYSGTLVVQGQGVARVSSTGSGTEIGKIGKALQAVEPEETLLQRETGRLVKLLATAGILLCALVIALYGLTYGNWMRGFLAGLTLAMATLPEEFPVVLTIFLALGAWRISQKRVLTRRVPAIETLGSATVLCVDKTGTLTLNRMTVQKLVSDGHSLDVAHTTENEVLPERFHELVEFSVLASQRDPFDPMEKAIKMLGDSGLAETEHLHANWTLVHQYPLSQRLLALSHVWTSPDGEDYIIAAKGAPEAIGDLCHFDNAQTEALATQVEKLAADGLRVLGVAKASFTREDLPGEQHDFKFEFLGLVGLADPVRHTVPAAISECYEAGIRVVMITGDYPGTARNIAGQIGLRPAEEVITGPELDQFSDDELRTRVKTVNIFARVVPEQKLRLVNALKANGEIVAMTGDGVNDAPALKSAHIGIAMGGRGTDVAREASALVLLDDDFSSIVQAVRMGRRIFDNIKKAMAYILSVHVPIAGMSLIPVLFRWPAVLTAVHVVFLELIIDPASSIVFEAETEEAGVMNRPPRNLGEPMFGRRMVGISVLQGLGVLLAVLAVFALARRSGASDPAARAMAFSALIAGNLGLILTNRSWSRTIFGTLRVRNNALWWVIGGAILFLGLALYSPALQKLFRFAPTSAGALAVSLAAGLVSVMWFELYKVIRRHRESRT